MSVARIPEAFDPPVVLSTVKVAQAQEPAIPALRALLSDSREIDRTTLLWRPEP